MPSLPILARLPPGYAVEEGPRGALAVRADLASALRASGWGLSGDGALGASDLSGRGPLGELQLDGRPYVVRRYSHGGLLRWITGARFLEPERPFRELCVAHEVERLGLRTPPVVAARALRIAGGGWTLDVVVERVERSLDLAHLLVRADLSRRARALLVRAAGALVRRMHDRGLLHADLTPRNLLVSLDGLDEGQPRLWILDLDRSVVKGSLGVEERRRNLRRLYRHVARLARGGVLGVSRSNLARFLAAYEPERSARREHWRAIQRAHEASLALHAAGWMLERGFSRSRRDPPAPGGRSR